MSHAGKESIKRVKRSIDYIIYNYRHADGALFQCIKPTLEDCRRSRDLWLEKCYLLEAGQVVYNIQYAKNYLILNPKIKGYVMLIQMDTARIRCILRNLFFLRFSLFGPDNQSRRMNNTETYTLMLKAYHLQFSKTRKIINKI